MASKRKRPTGRGKSANKKQTGSNLDREFAKVLAELRNRLKPKRRPDWDRLEALLDALKAALGELERAEQPPSTPLAAAAASVSNWIGDTFGASASAPPWPDYQLNAKTVTALSAQVLGATKVRVVGRTHSYSDVLFCEPGTTLLRSQSLMSPKDALLPVDGKRLVRSDGTDSWVRIDGRVTVGHAAGQLWENGLAFYNQGGFSHQTFAGAVTCSTHGSGSQLPPLCDTVDAFDFLGADGEVTRVQLDLPWLTQSALDSLGYGVTAKRIVDREALNAARVSLGQFGILLAAVVRVRSAYKLGEKRVLSTWQKEGTFANLDALAKSARHVELWVNPNGRSSDPNLCLIVTRVERPVTDADDDAGYSDPAQGKTGPDVQDLAAEFAYGLGKNSISAVLDQTLFSLQSADPARLRIATPNAIFHTGRVNEIHARSGEYFFPFDQNFPRVVDQFISLIQSNLASGPGIPHPGWLSIRFTKGSASHLSMVHGTGIFASIELPLITGYRAAVKNGNRARIVSALDSYQRLAMQEPAARFHWAQFWTSPDWASYRARFPKWSAWSKWRDQIGGTKFSNGIF